MKLSTRSLAACVALACAAASGVTFAQTNAELFAKHSEYRDATLSPSGEYVAVTTPYADGRALSIIKLSGKFDRNVIKFDPSEAWSGHIVRQQPVNPRWTGDTRLIVEKAKDYGYLGQLVTTGDVYAADANAGNQVQLFGYLPDNGNIRSRFKDEGWAYFMKLLPDTKGEAMFYYVPRTAGNSKNTTSIFRVDTYSGLRKQVATFPDSVSASSDNAGVIRFVLHDDLDGKQHVRYRRLSTDADLVPAPAWLAGSRMGVWYFEPDNNHAYAEISDHGEPATLYRVALSEGTRERVAGNASMEVSNVLRKGYEGTPFGVFFTAGRPKVDYTDPKSEWAQLHAGLMKLFQGQLVHFAGVSRDNSKILLFVYSDRNPGAYYLFDRTTNTPKLLFQSMEWIDPAKMAPTLPIEFKNRGGQNLFGFYTAPLGKQGPHALVVLPHGGPFGVSDSWSYDPDVQFLASLGYAVLQVNYRGSGYRGEAFETSAYRQWGTGIQDDIADGVKHVIAQKWVDPNKVCIYGASFGGYSAMMNPIRNPGMYKCAIGYAGVYNLTALYSDGDASRQGRSWLGRTMGDADLFRVQSPTNLVSSLDVPMLLIHGKADYVAPIAQYDFARAALSKAGKPFESLVVANEGHGFYKEANQAEAYRRMQAFLLKYNPPN